MLRSEDEAAHVLSQILSELRSLRGAVDALRGEFDIMLDAQNPILEAMRKRAGTAPREPAAEVEMELPFRLEVLRGDEPDNQWATGSDLYSHYRRHCANNRHDPVSPPRFAKLLNAAGFKGKHTKTGTR